jgi:hypothetical protein
MGIGGQFGNLAVKNKDGDKLTGQEATGMFWYQLQRNESGIDLGVMASLRSAQLSNEHWSGPARQTDLGLGIGKRVSDQATIFFDVVYSKVSVTLDLSSSDVRDLEADLSAYYGKKVTVSKAQETIEEDSAMLFAVGTEIRAGEKGAIVLELHAGAESGFAFGFRLGF